MTLEIKHNLGDPFWVMKNNKPTLCTVDSVLVGAYRTPSDNYSHVDTVKVLYRCEHTNVSVEDKEFYPTKEDLLATL